MVDRLKACPVHEVKKRSHQHTQENIDSRHDAFPLTSGSMMLESIDQPLTAFNSSHASCQSGGAASDASMSPLTTLVVHFSLVAMGTDNIMAQTQHSTKFGRTDCLCAPTAKQRPAAPFNSSLDICCQRHVGDNFPCCQIHGHVGM